MLDLFDKGSCYYQGKWINKHEHGKERYYNEYYDDDLDLGDNDFEQILSVETETKNKKSGLYVGQS